MYIYEAIPTLNNPLSLGLCGGNRQRRPVGVFRTNIPFFIYYRNQGKKKCGKLGMENPMGLPHRPYAHLGIMISIRAFLILHDGLPLRAAFGLGVALIEGGSQVPSSTG